MSYSVSGTTITLTRGDTFKAVVSITQQDGSPYVPAFWLKNPVFPGVFVSIIETYLDLSTAKTQ